jgi:hypothetical protein
MGLDTALLQNGDIVAVSRGWRREGVKKYFRPFLGCGKIKDIKALVEDSIR